MPITAGFSEAEGMGIPGEKTRALGFRLLTGRMHCSWATAGRKLGASDLSTVQLATWRGRLEAHLLT